MHANSSSILRFGYDLLFLATALTAAATAGSEPEGGIGGSPRQPGQPPNEMDIQPEPNVVGNRFLKL